MGNISSADRGLLRAGPDQLAEIEELLAEMLGPPPANIRDARVTLALIRKQFALVISLATREQRAMLTLAETEIVLDLLAERSGHVAPARLRPDGAPSRAVSVKEARGMVTTVALRLGRDPNSFWLELIEGLLKEDRQLVDHIASLARMQVTTATRTEDGLTGEESWT